MYRFRRIMAQVVSALVILAAPAACAARFGLHEIEDLVAAGFPASTIRSILQETNGDVSLSQADLERLKQAGLPPDVLAFLRERAQQAADLANAQRGAVAAAEEETPSSTAPVFPGERYAYGYYSWPYDYPYYLYPYVAPFGAFGSPFFVGGGGFHHHHDHFVGYNHDHFISAGDHHDLGHHDGFASQQHFSGHFGQ